MTKGISLIVAPQLNVNDETSELVDWKVANGSCVRAGEPICGIETMKSLVEITAEEDGVIYQIVPPRTTVKTGECLGLIGKDQALIDRYLSDMKNKKGVNTGKTGHEIKATTKARELAAKHDVSLTEVLMTGIKGTIKESDVERYLAGQKKNTVNNAPAIPQQLSVRIENIGHMPHQKIFVAEKLRGSLNKKLPATIDAEIELTLLNAHIKRCKERGLGISLLHIAMRSLGKVLSKYGNFTTFHFDNQLFRYREIDIAFIVKTFDGLLYAPVVRAVNKLGVKELVQECGNLTLKANRHELKPEEMEGACFTVSYMPHPAINRFVALIDEFQSAILAIAGEKNIVRLDNNKPVTVPIATMTLSYDHAIIDGWDSAIFLEHLNKEMRDTTESR